MEKERPPVVTVICVVFFVQLMYMGLELFHEMTTHASNALGRGEHVTPMNIPLHLAMMLLLGFGLKGMWDMKRWGVYTASAYFIARIIYEFSQVEVAIGSVALCLICLGLPWIYVTQMEE